MFKLTVYRWNLLGWDNIVNFLKRWFLSTMGILVLCFGPWPLIDMLLIRYQVCYDIVSDLHLHYLTLDSGSVF